MLTKDARWAAVAFTLAALCLAYSGAAFAEGQRGKPDFKKQSMTRSSAPPTGRASKPDLGTASATRAARRPATKASAASIDKERMARLNAPSSHRASTPEVAKQPATRSGEPSATKAGQETAEQPATRSAGTTETRGARAVADEPAVRSVETGEARGPRRTSASLGMTRSAKPPLRAPEAGLQQALAMRAGPQEQSKRLAHVPKEQQSVRMTRGTWLDWLFGR